MTIASPHPAQPPLAPSRAPLPKFSPAQHRLPSGRIADVLDRDHEHVEAVQYTGTDGGEMFLDRIGVHQVLELMAVGVIPEEIAMRYKVRIPLLNAWLRSRATPQEIADARRSAAAIYRAKAVRVVEAKVPADRTELAHMKLKAEVYTDMAKTMDPEEWNPRPGDSQGTAVAQVVFNIANPAAFGGVQTMTVGVGEPMAVPLPSPVAPPQTPEFAVPPVAPPIEDAEIAPDPVPDPVPDPEPAPEGVTIAVPYGHTPDPGIVPPRVQSPGSFMMNSPDTSAGLMDATAREVAAAVDLLMSKMNLTPRKIETPRQDD